MPRTTRPLAGQAVLITGAARGIGAELARKAAARGARVALVGLEPELLAQVDALRTTRDETSAWLREQGFEVAESDANFVLFGRFDDRHAVWQGVLDRGVLIREVGPLGWLRVSIGTPDEMLAFRSALQEATR